MARICEICQKQKGNGHIRKLLRGHYNVTANRSFKPNVQKITVDGEHLLACTNCIRTLHKAGRV